MAEAVLQKGVAQSSQVPAQHPADIRPQHQVDDWVVDGGGLGEHGRQGERQRRDVLDVSEGRPHRHRGVGAPCGKETDADSNTQLAGKRSRKRKVEFVLFEMEQHTLEKRGMTLQIDHDVHMWIIW